MSVFVSFFILLISDAFAHDLTTNQHIHGRISITYLGRDDKIRFV